MDDQFISKTMSNSDGKWTIVCQAGIAGSDKWARAYTEGPHRHELEYWPRADHVKPEAKETCCKGQKGQLIFPAGSWQFTAPPIVYDVSLNSTLN